jgi:hypothetical protein
MKNSIATVFTAQAENNDSKKPAGLATSVFTSKDGKVNIFVNKEHADATTTLLLKNATGAIVYSETIGKTNQKFGRILNLNELESGKYQLEISSNGETQSKSIQLSEQTTERVLTVK